LTVRPLRSEDRPAWQPLWDGYLRFYRAELDPATTDDAFARLAEQRDDMFGLVAEQDGGLVGFAHVVVHPSTWTTGRYAYLEDLYVSGAGRGTGAGQALIEAVYARADELGAPHVYWHTQEYNGAARSLYDQVASRTSFIVYEHLAQGVPPRA
jgi:GNAT superfamily N-acetyltransferase